MDIRAYSNFADIPLTRDEWNGLIAQNATNTLFQTYEWLSTWWQVFSNVNELCFLLITDNGEVIGFAPCMLNINQFGRKSLHFLADPNSDYCDFIIKSNSIAAIDTILEYLRTEYSSWVCMQLRNIPEMSPTLATLKTLCPEKKWHTRESHAISTPRLELSDPVASGNWQYSIRRPYNRMRKAGSLRYRHITDLQEAEHLLETLVTQHRARYHQRGEASLFDKPANIQFYKNLIPALSQPDWLDFCVLELDEKPVALHFGFKYNNTLTWYKPSFDIEYSNYSPGTVLTKYLIEYAQDAKFDVLDFTIGDEPFKERFSSTKEYNRWLSIYKKSTHANYHSLRELSARLNRRFLSRKK